MRIKYHWQGKAYEWDGIDLDEAEKIKAELVDEDGKAMLPLQFDRALLMGDPSAIKMMVALIQTRSGTPTNFEDVKGKVKDFRIELIDEDDDGGKDQPEPTGSNGSTNGSRTSTRRSRTTRTNSGSTTA